MDESSDLPSPASEVTAVVRSPNAIRHGLRTAALIIPGRESAGDWEQFSADALRSLAADGAVESALAGRIVELLWRMRRVARAEHQMIVDEYEHDFVAERQRLDRARADRKAMEGSFYASAFDAEPREVSARLLPHDADLQQIIRYEAHLSRQLYHALHELEALQERRRGNAAPLVRVAIHGLPGE